MMLTERKSKKTMRLLNDDPSKAAGQMAQSANFWVENFGEKTEIPWDDFCEIFMDKFVSELYSDSEKENLLVMLRRELAVIRGQLKKEKYDEFVTMDNGVVPFFRRVLLFATESMAVREVFDMDSQLRIDAINNLGKYKSQAVVEGLLDLLEDYDPNVRAVALMSLAKTGQRADRVVSRMILTLDDKDRLVRESACLALGRLKIKGDEVVRKIVHIWRNDVIASVRESAELALQQLDSEEARTAVHMTQLLKKEIQMLRE